MALQLKKYNKSCLDNFVQNSKLICELTAFSADTLAKNVHKSKGCRR